MPSTPDHDRSCILANNALEILLDKQKHADRCPQCKIDERFCDEAKNFDRQFRTTFATWLVYRPKGGVTYNGRPVAVHE